MEIRKNIDKDLLLYWIYRMEGLFKEDIKLDSDLQKKHRSLTIYYRDKFGEFTSLSKVDAGELFELKLTVLRNHYELDLDKFIKEAFPGESKLVYNIFQHTESHRLREEVQSYISPDELEKYEESVKSLESSGQVSDFPHDRKAIEEYRRFKKKKGPKWVIISSEVYKPDIQYYIDLYKIISDGASKGNDADVKTKQKIDELIKVKVEELKPVSKYISELIESIENEKQPSSTPERKLKSEEKQKKVDAPKTLSYKGKKRN